MKIKSPKLQAIRFAEPVLALAVLAWFTGPTLGLIGGPFNPMGLAAAVVPDQAAAMGAWIAIQAMVWLIPVLAVWKFVSPFLAGVLPVVCEVTMPLAILVNVLLSALVLVAQIIHALAFGNGLEYFLDYPPVLWGITGLTLIWNAVSIVALIRSFSRQDASWMEYQEFKKANADDKRGIFSRNGNWGIQQRLVVSFIIIIFAIITVLGGVLLNDFSKTIMNAVEQNGMNITDQTAGVLRTSFSDPITVVDFVLDQAEKNQAADFRFNSLAFWRLDTKNNLGIAAFSTAYVTFNAAGEGTYDEKAELQTRAWDNDQQLKQAVSRESADGQQLIFLAPVVVANKYLGNVEAVYEKSVILKPYYQTQFKVYLIAGIFLYLTVFITYLFGRNIVIPILFLRMSVNTISKMLAEMIHGMRKINTGDLMYQDRVNSRDEIKSLSTEIGNMATVIRGVIPYISASTLKAAERSAPSSEKRDLCFLFTDIRGFTTLCEGHEPAEIVEMLNHFLELQSSVILDNNGDIDKFVGDEIMAMFEGPDKELNAARAACEIRYKMALEKEIAQAANKKAVAIGIGINTGPVVFGSVGAHDRMDFTSIGDTVNLAARLEGANKQYGTKTLITEAVYVNIKEEFLCREIDFLTVKGKSQPVRVYEVLQRRTNATPKLDDLADRFEKGLTAYRKQDWGSAEQIFLHLMKEYDDETSEIFLKRVSMFRKNPPHADWDGVFDLTVK
jgi:class 3 adenylate cyclase